MDLARRWATRVLRWLLGFLGHLIGSWLAARTVAAAGHGEGLVDAC